MKLNGVRNQCQSCKKYFNSNGAFDKHRTGAFEVDRRCMTDEEMIFKGMFLGQDGFWRGEKMIGYREGSANEHHQMVEGTLRPTTRPGSGGAGA